MPLRQPPAWSEQAIRDTIAAITRDPAYGRVTEESLLSRALNWIGARIGDLIDLVRGDPRLRWVAIVLLIAVALVVVGRWVYEWRTAPPDAADATAERGGRASPWLVADRAAAEGRFDAAAHAVVEGVLAALAAQGAVRLHPSKTIGEYARELTARRHEHAAGFRALRAHYERCIYGDRRVGADAYATLRTMAEPLRRPTRAAAA